MHYSLTHSHARMHTCTHTNTPMQTHKHTHMRTHAHTYTHAHVHTLIHIPLYMPVICSKFPTCSLKLFGVVWLPISVAVCAIIGTIRKWTCTAALVKVTTNCS